MNSRLRALSDDLLNQAVAEYERTGQPQRAFLRADYQAESWPQPQPVVIKAEAHAQGTNRRAVVTNRPGCAVLPQAVYDGYAMRGESENRNKELKSELQADRLSDHRFLANFFRLYLHAAALNLLVRLRHAVVQPPPTCAALGLPAEPPPEALEEPGRKRFFNKRREPGLFTICRGSSAPPDRESAGRVRGDGERTFPLPGVVTTALAVALRGRCGAPIRRGVGGVVHSRPC
jgi:hypothetical protein